MLGVERVVPGGTKEIFSTTGVRILASFFLGVVVTSLVLFSSGRKPLDDPGLGWHLRTGEVILEGQLPRADPFLHAASFRPWVPDQWLADVVLFATHSALGWQGLSLLALLFFLAAFLYLPLLRVNSQLPFLYIFPVLGLAALLAQVQLLARPVIIGIFFFSLLLSWLHRCVANSRGPRLAILFLFFFLWSNTHPSFVLGLGAMAVLLVAVSIRTALLSSGVALLATVLGPYGVGLYDSVLLLGGSRYFQRLNSEWLPIEVFSVEGVAFLSLFALAIVGVCSKQERGCTHSWYTLLLFALACIFFVATVRSIRFLPFFCLVTLPISISGFRVFWSGIIPKVLRNRYELLASLRVLPAVVLASSFFLALFVFSFGVGASFFQAGGPSHERYPYAIMQFITKRVPNAVIAASPDYGGFITWQCRTFECQAVIDDRNQLLGEAFTRGYLEAFRAPLSVDFFQALGSSHLLLAQGRVAEDLKSRHPLIVVAFETDQHILFEVPPLPRFSEVD